MSLAAISRAARRRRLSVRTPLLVSVVLVGFVLIGSVLIGPGTALDAAGSAAAEPREPAFVGKTFSSRTVTGSPIPGGGPLEVSFPAANRIALSAGCNRHVGEVRVDGSLLRLSTLASTMMACPPPRDGADAWIRDFTAEPLTWHSVGRALILIGPRNQVLLQQDTR